MRRHAHIGAGTTGSARVGRAGRTLLMAVLAFLVFVPLSLLVPAGGGLLRTAEAKTQSELNDELEQTEKELEQAREGQEQAEATAQRALGDIEALDKEIEALRAELSELTSERDQVEKDLAATRAELDRLGAELRRKRDELAQAEADLAEVQEILNARAKNIYKMGGIGYLELILEADRLTDLVNRFQLLTKILQQDRDLVQQIEELRARVTEQKIALEEQRRAVAEIERRQGQQKAELDAVVAKRQAAEDKLEQARNEKAAVLARAEQDKALYEQQEDALLAESEKIQEELRALERAQQTDGRGTGEYVWPVNGYITSPFGYRVHPIFGTKRMHTGIDVGASWGTSIQAADSGTVVYAGWRGGYGKTIMISHGNGMSTLYAHQSTILVGVGESVARGDAIGKVGSTGYSTGPHLHFEVRSNGSPVNPMNYL